MKRFLKKGYKEMWEEQNHIIRKQSILITRLFKENVLLKEINEKINENYKKIEKENGK